MVKDTKIKNLCITTTGISIIGITGISLYMMNSEPTTLGAISAISFGTVTIISSAITYMKDKKIKEYVKNLIINNF